MRLAVSLSLSRPAQVSGGGGASGPTLVSDELAVSLGVTPSWQDTRYTVTFTVQDETGAILPDATVDFAGETKTTDANGEVVFERITSYPTVDHYVTTVSHASYPESTLALIRIWNRPDTFAAEIPLQMGVATAPRDLADALSTSMGLSSLTWEEVVV